MQTTFVHWDFQNWNRRACQVFNEQYAETCWNHRRPISKHAGVTVFSGMAMVQHLPVTLIFPTIHFGNEMTCRSGRVCLPPQKLQLILIKKTCPNIKLPRLFVVSKPPGVCYWIPLPFWTASILGALDHPTSRVWNGAISSGPNGFDGFAMLCLFWWSF